MGSRVRSGLAMAGEGPAGGPRGGARSWPWREGDPRRDHGIAVEVALRQRVGVGDGLTVRPDGITRLGFRLRDGDGLAVLVIEQDVGQRLSVPRGGVDIREWTSREGSGEWRLFR